MHEECDDELIVVSSSEKAENILKHLPEGVSREYVDCVSEVILIINMYVS
jgi:hypothetical protein